MDYDDYLDDIIPICSNCKYEGVEAWQCTCEQRRIDAENNVIKTGAYCAYFEEQAWITKEREKAQKG